MIVFTSRGINFPVESIYVKSNKKWQIHCTNTMQTKLGRSVRNTDYYCSYYRCKPSLLLEQQVWRNWPHNDDIYHYYWNNRYIWTNWPHNDDISLTIMHCFAIGKVIIFSYILFKRGRVFVDLMPLWIYLPYFTSSAAVVWGVLPLLHRAVSRTAAAMNFLSKRWMVRGSAEWR